MVPVFGFSSYCLVGKIDSQPFKEWKANLLTLARYTEDISSRSPDFHWSHFPAAIILEPLGFLERRGNGEMKALICVAKIALEKKKAASRTHPFAQTIDPLGSCY